MVNDSPEQMLREYDTLVTHMTYCAQNLHSGRVHSNMGQFRDKLLEPSASREFDSLIADIAYCASPENKGRVYAQMGEFKSKFLK